MPIYEYLCDKCRHEFEAEQRITEDPIRSCPKCRARKVQRLISQTSFMLKGSGWYSDLYSSSKPKADAEPAAKDGAASDAAAETPAKDAAEAKPPKDTPGPDSGGTGKKRKKKPEAKAAA